MSPATATTTAKAVRQHGGGLVHATLPRAALRGRQQCPSGGVKKSLCCAAAGINALDLPATTTRAYPMTGVRPARKLSIPLRSPIRPPAQLVVGYTHAPALGLYPATNHLHRNLMRLLTGALVLRKCAYWSGQADKLMTDPMNGGQPTTSYALNSQLIVRAHVMRNTQVRTKSKHVQNLQANECFQGKPIKLVDKSPLIKKLTLTKRVPVVRP